MNCDRTVKVWELLADISDDGPACTGTKPLRFRTRERAEAFAALSTCYGGPCKITESDVLVKISIRWGMA